jgi:hypothetical protein
MQIATVPASAGWTWIKTGFRLVRQQPLAVVTFTFMFMFLAAGLAFLPYIGGFSPPFLTPLLSVGLMAAMQKIEVKEVPRPGLIFEPLRLGKAVWKTLLVLGAINCLTYVVTLGVSALVDSGTWVEILLGRVKSAQDLPKDSPWMLASIVFFALYLPIQMAFWFAPLFVAWHQASATQSLFYSFVSVWRNKAAFAVYGLCWFGIAIAFALFTQSLATLIGPGPLGNLVIFPLLVLFLGAVMASMWATYRDVVRQDAE